MTSNIVMLLLVAIAFVCGFILIGAYNYFVLYIIRVSGFLKTLDNKIAIAVLSILFLIIFIVRDNGVAFAVGNFIGGILATVLPTYFSTYLLFKKKKAYAEYSRNIKNFASIYSGLSLLTITMMFNGDL